MQVCYFWIFIAEKQCGWFKQKRLFHFINRICCCLFQTHKKKNNNNPDIIHGKLDQKNKQLEVDYAIGRDIRPEDIKKISATLQEWCDSCESVLQTIENQIDSANAAKAMRMKHNEDLEAEVC